VTAAALAKTVQVAATNHPGATSDSSLVAANNAMIRRCFFVHKKQIETWKIYDFYGKETRR
jgi:hypothetical protein